LGVAVEPPGHAREIQSGFAGLIAASLPSITKNKKREHAPAPASEKTTPVVRHTAAVRYSGGLCSRRK
ncbi:MAG: hypothetical protein PVH25_00005, partial [Burkholderiales bacterium]